MWGTKLYNKLQHQLKNLKNTQLLRIKLKSLLLQQTPYLVEDHLSYKVLTWKM
jgi:hypothetical protein